MGIGAETTIASGDKKKAPTPVRKPKRLRNKRRTFVSYGKPRFPRARPFRFEWGNVNNGK